MIKVLIADDQELIRQSLQIVLNSRPDIMVTDVASNGQEVIRSVRKNKRVRLQCFEIWCQRISLKRRVHG